MCCQFVFSLVLAFFQTPFSHFFRRGSHSSTLKRCGTDLSISGVRYVNTLTKYTAVKSTIRKLFLFVFGDLIVFETIEIENQFVFERQHLEFNSFLVKIISF